MVKTDLIPTPLESSRFHGKDFVFKRVCVNPCDDPLWHQLVQGEETDVFHSPNWLTVLAKTYDFKIHAHMLHNTSNEPIAGIQLCKI